MEYKATEYWLTRLAEQLVIYNKNIELNHGIYIKIEIDVENYGYEKDGNTYHSNWRKSDRKILHFIIVKTHKVFMAVTDFRFGQDVPDPKLFKNMSNHDSCWRSDGIRDIWKEMCKSYELCFKHMPDEHKPCMAMANISVHPHFLGGDLFKFVKIELKNIPDDSYHYSISSIKELEYNITLN